MNIDATYAVKKDIQNNAVVREQDTQQRREYRRVVSLASLGVGMLLFSAWQHFQTLDLGMAIERLRIERSHEETLNRKLRLNLETLRAPEVIEARARRELGMQAPALADTLIIERAHASSPSRAVVARAR